jgi:hypothetical protein
VQCGTKIHQKSDFGFELSQEGYVNDIVEIPISKERWKQKETETTDKEKSALKGVLGSLGWHANQVAFWLSAAVSWNLSNVKCSTVQDLIEVNKLVKKAHAMKQQKLIIHAFQKDEELVAVAWEDAAHANRPDGSSTKGILIGLAPKQILEGDLVKVSVMFWQSAKIDRVCRSSGAAETRASVDAEDELYAVRMQWSEYLGHPVNLRNIDELISKTPGIVITDSRNVYDKLKHTVLTLKGAEKRTDIEALCLKDAMNTCNLEICWVNGDTQLANGLTKGSEPQQIELFIKLNFRWKIVYDPEMQSCRKRRSQGIQAMEHGQPKEDPSTKISSPTHNTSTAEQDTRGDNTTEKLKFHKPNDNSVGD